MWPRVFLVTAFLIVLGQVVWAWNGSFYRLMHLNTWAQACWKKWATGAGPTSCLFSASCIHSDVMWPVNLWLLSPGFPSTLLCLPHNDETVSQTNKPFSLKLLLSGYLTKQRERNQDSQSRENILISLEQGPASQKWMPSQETPESPLSVSDQDGRTR